MRKALFYEPEMDGLPVHAQGQKHKNEIYCCCGGSITCFIIILRCQKIVYFEDRGIEIDLV